MLSSAFPTRLRAKGVTIGTTANWCWNLIISLFSPRIADRIGSLIMLIFAAMMIVQIVYVYFLVRETRGLSLEEVDEMYRAHVKPWKSSKWQPSSGRRNGAQLTPAITTSSDKTLFSTNSSASEKGLVVTEVFGSHGVKKDEYMPGERRSLDSVDDVV
ncbi:hypothetical protein JCM8547_009181 [Rhodosporidiobolus lusitaniae]